MRENAFGKYKGRVIADLAGTIFNWLARRGFPHGESDACLRLMQGN